jgi:hypothetical protein
MKGHKWYDLVQEYEHPSHRACFAIIKNKSGSQLALGLFGEIIVVDLETLEEIRVLDDGITTECMDLASSPCG